MNRKLTTIVAAAAIALGSYACGPSPRETQLQNQLTQCQRQVGSLQAQVKNVQTNAEQQRQAEQVKQSRKDALYKKKDELTEKGIALRNTAIKMQADLNNDLLAMTVFPPAEIYGRNTEASMMVLVNMEQRDYAAAEKIMVSLLEQNLVDSTMHLQYIVLLEDKIERRDYLKLKRNLEEQNQKAIAVLSYFKQENRRRPSSDVPRIVD